MSQTGNIQPQVDKVNDLIEEVFKLDQPLQSIFVQKLIFAFPHRVKEQLIPLCLSLGASKVQIAKALGISPTLITRNFGKGTTK
jgi:hypothetical protein